MLSTEEKKKRFSGMQTATLKWRLMNAFEHQMYSLSELLVWYQVVNTKLSINIDSTLANRAAL